MSYFTRDHLRVPVLSSCRRVFAPEALLLEADGAYCCYFLLAGSQGRGLFSVNGAAELSLLDLCSSWFSGHLHGSQPQPWAGHLRAPCCSSQQELLYPKISCSLVMGK